MKIDRNEAGEHLKAGRPVAFRTPDGQGRTLTPQFGRRAVQALPPEDAEGTYHLLRDEHGNLTRAGMEQAIREGGSVMHPGLPAGEVIESIDDLPDEVDLVRGNERARKALAESLDAQLAALTAQRARLDAPAKPDEETPAVKQARQAQEQRAAEEEQSRQEAERQAKERGEVAPQHEADRKREALMARGLPPQQEQEELAALAQELGGAGEQPPGQQQQSAERERAAQEQARAAQRQRQEQARRQVAERKRAAEEEKAAREQAQQQETRQAEQSGEQK